MSFSRNDSWCFDEFQTATEKISIRRFVCRTRSYGHVIFRLKFFRDETIARHTFEQYVIQTRVLKKHIVAWFSAAKRPNNGCIVEASDRVFRARNVDEERGWGSLKRVKNFCHQQECVPDVRIDALKMAEYVNNRQERDVILRNMRVISWLLLEDIFRY